MTDQAIDVKVQARACEQLRMRHWSEIDWRDPATPFDTKAMREMLATAQETTQRLVALEAALSDALRRVEDALNPVTPAIEIDEIETRKRLNHIMAQNNGYLMPKGGN